MDILLRALDGRIVFRLTTQHAASSYDIPVLVEESTGKAFSYDEMLAIPHAKQLLQGVHAECDDLAEARRMWERFEPTHATRSLINWRNHIPSS